MEPYDALHAFRSFRDSFYECLDRRADALFDLADALLTAQAVPSPVHLSLQASHRRGWGSLYAALAHGTIDAEALRDLLARVPFGGAENEPPVFAVDVSVWDRCDAETSPGRGFYGDPSLSEPPANIGRPRRHGPKMKCDDPSTWPNPDHEYACERTPATGTCA
jgi:hypothetical protein